MATNKYFSQYPAQNRLVNEHKLMEDLINESIQIMGHNCYYIPRDSFDEGDMILGEYSKSKFNKAYLVEVYLANVEGFEGQSDFFSKFGLEIRDTSSFIVSKRAFNRHVPSTLRFRPQEGDLIYVPVFRKMFEIKFIEQELMFHSLGKRLPFVYEMRCEAFRFSQENIDTGVTEVDDVGMDNSYTIKINLLNNGTGSYVENDIVFQSPDGLWRHKTASGYVQSWDVSNNVMYLYNITGNFASGQNVYSNTTNAIYTMSGKDDMTDYVLYDIYDNKDLDTGADLILDLTEQNVFGTP